MINQILTLRIRTVTLRFIQSHVFTWTRVQFLGLRSIVVDSCGFLRIFADFCGFLRIVADSYGFLWNNMHVNQLFIYIDINYSCTWFNSNRHLLVLSSQRYQCAQGSERYSSHLAVSPHSAINPPRRETPLGDTARYFCGRLFGQPSILVAVQGDPDAILPFPVCSSASSLSLGRRAKGHKAGTKDRQAPVMSILLGPNDSLLLRHAAAETAQRTYSYVTYH